MIIPTTNQTSNIPIKNKNGPQIASQGQLTTPAQLRHCVTMPQRKHSPPIPIPDFAVVVDFDISFVPAFH